MSDKLTLTHYTIENHQGIFLKMAVVADLHDRQVDGLIPMVQKAKPDIILVPGDALERYDVGLGRLLQNDLAQYRHPVAGSVPPGKKRGKIQATVHLLERALTHILGALVAKCRHPKQKSGLQTLRELAGIAPTYYAMGNHEVYFQQADRAELAQDDVHVLDNQNLVLPLPGGKKILIGGLSSKPDRQWLEKFAQEPGYHVLMCHHPEYYPTLIREQNIQVIVSGHAHGGQIRVGNQGIYAPGQGFFPQYTKGVYEGRMVVSAGLCNNGILPRWGNPMEVVVIALRNP